MSYCVGPGEWERRLTRRCRRTRQGVTPLACVSAAPPCRAAELGRYTAQTTCRSRDGDVRFRLRGGHSTPRVVPYFE
jgi:hypothetical protein